MSPRESVGNTLNHISIGQVKTFLQCILLDAQLVVGIQVVYLLLRLTYNTEFRIAQTVAATSRAVDYGEVETSCYLLAFLHLGNIIEALPVGVIEHHIVEFERISTYPNPRSLNLHTLVRAIGG